MSKVTYLLGAGASYGSRGVLPLDKQPNISSDDFPPERGIIRGLPILQEFSNALNQLLGELTSITDFNAERKYILSEALNNILNVSIEYPTIDTYAKMLYATKRIKEYVKFKDQLSLFFLIWQKSHKHDLRYDSFIASLIDAETCTFPPLTILSWNYDMQFEMSYSKYILDERALWKIWDQLNVYCKSNGTLSYKSDNPFAFIKLNGSAMFHATQQDSYSLRYTLQDVLWRSYNVASGDDEKGFWNDVYEIYDNGQHKNLITIPKYANELSYAWDKFGKEELLQNISKRLADCEVLIVIGYSFPYVNREIDRHIIKSMPNLKNIHIQDKNPDSIAERVKSIYEYINHPMPAISKHEKDLDTFYIPNELG